MAVLENRVGFVRGDPGPKVAQLPALILRNDCLVDWCIIFISLLLYPLLSLGFQLRKRSVCFGTQFLPTLDPALEPFLPVLVAHFLGDLLINDQPMAVGGVLPAFVGSEPELLAPLLLVPRINPQGLDLLLGDLGGVDREFLAQTTLLGGSQGAEVLAVLLPGQIVDLCPRPVLSCQIDFLVCLFDCLECLLGS